MKRISFFITGVVLLTISCGKNYLDEDPKAQITPINFYKTASDLDAAVRGLLVLHNQVWNQTGGLAVTFGSDDMTTWRGGRYGTKPAASPLPLDQMT